MSFMPEVKMDFIPEDMTDESGEEESIIEEFNEDKDKPKVSDAKTQEEIEIQEVEEVEQPKIPKAKSKREDMNIDDIFNMPQPSIQPPQGAQAEVKLTKKGKPRKKRPPMSEEHKAKLALAREKAMASRKKKAQERKENKALETEEKELLKKQKVKRVKKLKEEVEDDDGSILDPPTKNQRYASQKESIQMFSKQDLEEAQLQAIMNYEKIRKTRKAEKQVRQKKEAEQEALKAQLRRAVAPPQQEYNPFNGCY